MNVLFLSHVSLMGTGSGTYIDALARSFIQFGHQVSVLSAEHSISQDTPYTREPIYFRDEINASKHADLPFNYASFLPHPLTTRTFDTLSESEYAKYRAKIKSKIKQVVSHTQFHMINVLHGWIIGDILHELGLEFLVTLMGPETVVYERGSCFRKEMENSLIHAKKIICFSEEYKGRIVSVYHVDPEQVIALPPGVDPDAFSIRNACKNHPIKQLLFVGRLTEPKGILVLLKALSAPEIRDKFRVAVVGDGSLRKACEAFLKDNALLNIDLLGHQPQNEVARLMSESDVLVVPSLHETGPLVALEAMASGVPVIGTRVGLLPQLLAEGRGVLCDSDSVDSLSKALLNFTNREKPLPSGKELREFVLSQYAWQNTTVRLLSLERGNAPHFLRSSKNKWPTKLFIDSMTSLCTS